MSPRPPFAGGCAFFRETSDDLLDVNRDAVLTADDFRLILKPRLQQILSAVERQDDDWIWTNVFRVGARWIQQHQKVEPNRTRTPRLDLFLFLFHGTDDANCPVQGGIDIGNTARERGRTSLRTFIVPDHDHSLEFVSWAVSGSLPEGLTILFDQVEQWTTGFAGRPVPDSSRTCSLPHAGECDRD